MNVLKPYLALLAGLTLLAASLSHAAEMDSRQPLPDPAKPSPFGHRFLFIVETSSDNRKFEESNRQALFDLVVRGVSGQMLAGDTFGIWTFSDDVRLGEFPMTVYDPDRALQIAGRAAAFLQSAKYAKKPDSKPVVRQLRVLSEKVPDFNVFLLTSGRHPIEGTPFDYKINGAYDALAPRPGKLALKPLVTTFVVRQGRPLHANVIIAGDRIALPERTPPPALSPSPALPGTNHADVAALTPTPSAIPATTSPDETASLATGTSPAPRTRVMQIITHSNQTASSAVPNPPIPGTNSAPGALLSPAGETNLFLQPEADQASTATSPHPLSASASASSSTKGPSSQNEGAQATTDPTFSITPIARILAAAAANVGPDPVPVAAREASSSTTANSHSEPAPVPPQSSSSASPPVMATGAPVPPNVSSPGPSPSLSPAVLLSIGGGLLAGICLIVFLVLRRMPPPTRGSLISQSMRRE